MPRETAVKLRITGRVQGVGYRAWAASTAAGLGLTGWVRNLSDGSVEALVAGDPAAVRAFIAAAHDGPPAARVDAITEGDGGAEPMSSGFVQRPTV